MGRLIDLTKPLNEEDREYLLSRSREGEVAVNDRQFAHLDEDGREEARAQHEADEAVDQAEQDELDAIDDDGDGFDDDLIDQVAPLKVAELRARLQKEGLDSDGNKDELQERLLNFLQDQREAANGS